MSESAQALAASNTDPSRETGSDGTPADGASSDGTESARAGADQTGIEQRDRGATATDVPERRRYRVIERDGRSLVISGNAPNIELHVERGLSVDGGGRKRFGAQAIFLDGVYTGAPFVDNEARQYSLDHHAECVRAFTLATCEQAVVMLLQGLPLSAGTWTLWINDPDLDSMLAAWVLMNHVELLRDERAPQSKRVLQAHSLQKRPDAREPFRAP